MIKDKQSWQAVTDLRENEETRHLNACGTLNWDLKHGKDKLVELEWGLQFGYSISGNFLVLTVVLYHYTSMLLTLGLLCHYFANKGPSSQSYSFSSSHVWMWKLDYRESWVRKNWCFWTVVSNKTVGSPLDCQEIKPVHPRGNQSWIFIEGLMLKLKL